MAICFLAACLLAPPGAVAPAGPPVATIDEALDVQGEDVAARLAAQRMFVPVTVEGAGPYRFIVDSGADRSVIGAGLAQRLRLPPGPAVVLHGTAGVDRVGTVRIGTLVLGRSVVRDIAAPALRESFIGADGLIGIDALGGQRLTLDFARKLITVEPAEVPRAAASDEIVVTARRRGGQLIITQASVAGTRVYAIIDTGSQVTIGNMALAGRVLGRQRTPGEAITLTSVTGRTIQAQLAVLRDLRVARLTLRGVSVAFADVPPFALFGVADRPAILLGTDVLEAFERVSLDFKRKKVRFQLR